MFHEVQDVIDERRRLFSRPASDQVPPVLGTFTVQLDIEPVIYGTRVRSVLNAAYQIAASVDFDESPLPTQDFPSWFAQVSQQDAVSVPSFAKSGRDLYLREHGDFGWDLEDWLYRFEPEESIRGWSWWDMTQTPAGDVCVWVDTWGESFISSQDLRWLLCTAGARSVSEYTLMKSGGWLTQSTVPVEQGDTGAA
ncbi:hypothetical protein [Streptomyces violens]|uniref:hypothetical protein n=1 Tax=Streptomyces violens TaxID=66377 RepID=UPI0012FF478A|nr:hypothetical protein [Streptomyces violens]